MSLLSLPALALLLAVPLLLWLAWRSRRPRRVEVGTLWLWRKLAERQSRSQSRSRRFDLLLWLCLGAVLVGAFGAARPAWLGAPQAPRVAVFVEALTPGAPTGDVAERAQALVPDARLTFFASAGYPDADQLTPGPIEAQLAQFEARTAGFDARLLFLCAPLPQAERIGAVLPRATEPQRGVLYGFYGSGDEIVLRLSPGPAPTVEGGRLADGAVRPSAGRVSLTDAAGNRVTLRQRPLVVGVGRGWQTDRHRALYAALRAAPAGDEPPDVWLGGDEFAPAVRVGLGRPADLADAEIVLHPAHALFAELPVGLLDWPRDRALEPGGRPLAAAWRDGERLGDLAALREGGRVLEFAGDPFGELPIELAALLLDNAIGVVTGERPSRRERFALIEGTLSTERAAHAVPFEPQGLRQPPKPRTAAREWGHWPLIAAAFLMLAATSFTGRATNGGATSGRANG